MGVSINGKIPSGFAVNGKSVSGLAYDGKVIYRKEPRTIYRRRIEVGDNLRGKTIYQDFNTIGWSVGSVFTGKSYKDIFAYYHSIISKIGYDDLASSTNWKITEGSETFLQTNNLTIYDDWSFPTMQVKCSISNILPWRYDASHIASYSNNISITSDTDEIVSSITNQISYRRLYIEDPYIRPFKVGDKINQNTTIYCIIPDYYGLAAIADNGNTEDYSTTGFSVSNDTIKFDYTSNNYWTWSEYIIKCTVNSTVNDIFNFSYDNDYDLSAKFVSPTWNENVSKLDFSGQTFETEVTSIDENLFRTVLYNYLLVDTRTLVK